MEFLISDLILNLLGRIFLFIKYRKALKIKKILQEEFEGSYSEAGKTLIFSFVGLIGIFFIVVFILAIIIGIYRFGIKDS